MSLKSKILRTSYWTNDFFKGSPIRSHYNDIKQILNNSDTGRKRRVIYLNNLLQYTVKNSSFYSSYDAENINSFPVVNKSVLLKNYDQIKVDENEIPKQKGEVFIQKTSGSTGTPFAIPQDTRKRNRRIAELKYFGEIVGFKSHDTLVHLRTWNRWQSKTNIQSIKENIIPFDISVMNSNKLSELTHIIRKKNVTAIRGYASSIDLLVRYVSENNILLPSLRIIISGSEALLDSTRDLVKKHLGCNIISQYANEENGILAQENLSVYGRDFYLNHASYFFEILKLDLDEPAEFGELGRIVLTDLFNYAFPVIRYDTGDTGIMNQGTEESSGYPILTNLYGRRVDLIYNTTGSVVFPIAISRTLKNYSDIVQWQFIQNDKNNYDLKIVKKDSFSISEEDDILNQFKELIGFDAIIKIIYTDDIPVLASGKRKPVVNNWKR